MRNDWNEWGGDVLSPEAKRARAPKAPERVAATRDLVVELPNGFVGAVVGTEAGSVQLEDRRGKVRLFPLGRGFLIDGVEVELIRPSAPAPQGAVRTASGSRAVVGHTARVARASRILVEGKHDAELVEKVWGHDLRVEGVVVEPLHGVDDLEAIVADFRPTSSRKLGVLVDHLVPRSKESRIAETIARGPYGKHVLVVGHPYIDIWQAVVPARLGFERWPDVPKGEDFKLGTLARIGWPHADAADSAAAWQRILASVRDWNDLDPALLGRVEELIDFVTVGAD